MISFFIVKSKFTAAIVIACIMVFSVVLICIFNRQHIFDIYSIDTQINKNENSDERIPVNEINEWRNKFKHPLVLPSINLLNVEKNVEINNYNETHNVDSHSEIKIYLTEVSKQNCQKPIIELAKK